MSGGLNIQKIGRKHSCRATVIPAKKCATRGCENIVGLRSVHLSREDAANIVNMPSCGEGNYALCEVCRRQYGSLIRI